jgi:hypothetical protein
MKKFTIAFLCAFILLAISSIGQDQFVLRKSPNPITREASLQCPPGSVFSQVPEMISAGWGIENPLRVADDFTASSAPLAMRFWGLDLDFESWSSCQPPEMTFIIRFYERNLADPFIPGDEVVSYTLSAVPEFLNIFWGGDFQVEVTFPEPVPVTDGWVSISRVNAGDPCFSYWLAEDAWGMGTGNACIYMYFEDEDLWRWQSGIPVEIELNMAFCLEGPVPPVPVSNLALIIGILLIGTFILIKYKRA